MLARITINLILMGLFCSLALAEQPTGWKWSKIETTANTSIIMDHKIEFFSVGEDIHIILWNHIDSNTTAANSTLARFKSLRAVAQIEFYLLTPAHLVRLISGFFSSRFLQTHK